MKLNGLGILMSGFAARVARALSRLISGIGRHRGIFYVNGAGTLPPPLTSDEEARVIAELDGNGGGAARQTLIEHNLRLVVYIAGKFGNTGTGIEDLVSIGTIGLIKAINTFRADKNIKLATYASRCIENEILMYIRKSSGKREVSIDEPLSVDWDGNELLLSDILGSDEDDVSRDLEKNEEKKTIRDAIRGLDEREQVIINLRYGLNGGRELTQKEVADMMGISQSYISRLEKKILSRLGEELRGKV
ncbi:MAG: RNA polymerase sporulation sigma factor SigK [Eubacteriales bacterium]|nr:RNA polymerase sporulation sigma factor SigK [Clostridiales bacterium]MDD7301163.1 RNA polymerase sporulation sigma factor SigK [Eubacteriales bacterium]MDY4434753.1 RNA polymerase sporulation sigma factor SigK [Candidatus Flemingibacterium sp.]